MNVRLISKINLPINFGGCMISKIIDVHINCSGFDSRYSSSDNIIAIDKYKIMSTTIGKGSDDSSDDSLKKPSTISETQKESFNQDDNDDNGSVDLHDDGHKMRSGQGWGRGIVADVKRTIGTHWKEEMVNLNSKV